MTKVVTFGEVMLRLATMRRERFTQAREFEVTYGGGECNVAVSLAQFGIDATFVTAIPDNDIGQACINYIRQFGVDTSEVLRQGQRLGTYYLESGAAMRASKVVYDRAASSIAEIKPGEVDWEKVFQGKDWFHFTGITPAISKSAADACEEAAAAAKQMGLTVSADMNYRNSTAASIAANDTSVTLAYRQFFNGGVGVQVTGTFSGTLQFEMTIDGTNFVAVQATSVTTGAVATTATGVFFYNVVGAQSVRVTSTAWTSGTAVVTVAGLPG